MRRLLTISTYSLALLWGVPLFWVIITAFRPDGGSGFSFANFVNAWNAAPFLQYYFNTTIIALVVFAFQFVTTTLAAYAFARLSFPFKNTLFILYLIQIMIPVDVLIFPNYGTIAGLGLVDSKLGIMIPYFISAFGVFLLRQAFKGIPIELEEAAKMEGCSLWHMLWYIYVPLAKPTFVAFGLVSISHQWSNFLWPLIVTNSVNNRPLSVGLSIFAKTTESSAQWGQLAAATLLVIFPLVLAFFIFQKQFISSFMQSGIK